MKMWLRFFPRWIKVDGKIYFVKSVVSEPCLFRHKWKRWTYSTDSQCCGFVYRRSCKKCFSEQIVTVHS